MFCDSSKSTLHGEEKGPRGWSGWCEGDPHLKYENCTIYEACGQGRQGKGLSSVAQVRNCATSASYFDKDTPNGAMC